MIDSPSVRARIVRRAIVAAVLFAVFFIWAGPPRSIREILLPLLAILAAAIVIATFLSWPSRRWIRALIFAGLAALIAIFGRRDALASSTPILEAVITVLPVFFLLGIVLAVDAVVAVLLGKMRRTSSARAA
jgi:uncharacterized membrane protein